MKVPRAFLGRFSTVILMLTLLWSPLRSARVVTAQENPNQENKVFTAKLGTTILSDISVTAGPQGVLLSWRTTSEVDNLGFNIYRERNGIRELVNLGIIPGSLLRL